MSIVIAYELLREASTPLVITIGEDTSVAYVLSTIEKIKKFIDSEVIEKLDRAFNEALENEIHKALNTDELEHEFPMLAVKFWARVALPLMEFCDKIYVLDVNDLKELRDVEGELAKAVASVIKNSDYSRADDLIYALSILIDRDLWILDKVSKLGFNDFIKKFIDRASNIVLQFSGYTVYLTFAWIASISATLGIAKEYKEENRDTLTAWCREYAKEVDNYLDTLDLLLDDEVYEDLAELGIIKR